MSGEASASIAFIAAANEHCIALKEHGDLRVLSATSDKERRRNLDRLSSSYSRLVVAETRYADARERLLSETGKANGLPDEPPGPFRDMASTLREALDCAKIMQGDKADPTAFSSLGRQIRLAQSIWNSVDRQNKRSEKP